MVEYLKLSEVARRLDVSEKTARRYVKAGTLPSVFIGGAYRVSEEDLEEFLRRARVEPGKAPAPPSRDDLTFNHLLEEERRTAALRPMAAYVASFAENIEQGMARVELFREAIENVEQESTKALIAASTCGVTLHEQGARLLRTFTETAQALYPDAKNTQSENERKSVLELFAPVDRLHEALGELMAALHRLVEAMKLKQSKLEAELSALEDELSECEVEQRRTEIRWLTQEIRRQEAA